MPMSRLTDDGLGDVVRQAHPAIETQISYRPAAFGVLIEEDEGGDQYQRESQFLPHVQDGAYGLLYDGILSHEQFLERV